MNKPDFFIIGAPKCGTSAMADYLAQHPEIFFSHPKEPNYFGEDLTGWRPIKTLDEYLNLFRKAGNKVCGEGSVWSLFSKTAAKEIYDFNPDAKIIVMLRNPIEVLHSLHNQLVYDGDEDIEDFKLAIEAESERRKGLHIPKTCIRPEAIIYTDVVRFAEQLQRFIDIFGRSQIHIIVYDDFRKNLLEVYRNTLVFLNVNSKFEPKITVVNPSKRVKSKLLQNFLVVRPPLIQAVSRIILPQSLRGSIATTIKLLNTSYESRQPIDPELRKRLQSEFTSEVEQLSKLLNRDLTYWNKG